MADCLIAGSPGHFVASKKEYQAVEIHPAKIAVARRQPICDAPRLLTSLTSPPSTVVQAPLDDKSPFRLVQFEHRTAPKCLLLNCAAGARFARRICRITLVHMLSLGLIASPFASGCRTTHIAGKPLPAGHEAYVRYAIEKVEYENGPPISPAVDLFPSAPLSEDRSQDEQWPMVLFSAIHIAMHNTAIVKQDAQFLSAANPLHLNVEAAASALDPQIQSSSINFGDRGLAAALSDFTPRLSGNMLWGREETVQNTPFSAGLPPGSVLNQDTANFDLRWDKQMAWGGQFTVDNTINYTSNNVPSNLFPSVYTGASDFRYTQPLWAGSGTEFTQIAGPAALLAPRILSVNQGVLIARISEEMDQIEFEEAINRLTKDVTDVYWELHLAQDTLRAEQETLTQLKTIWDKQRTDAELGRATVSTEAEAADAYYSETARVAEVQSSMNTAELRLRRLLGLPTRDGRLIVAVDIPETDSGLPDFSSGLADALAQRPELRRTKWQLQSLQLQLKAARKLIAPRMDLQAGYHVNAFGNDLLPINSNPAGVPSSYRSYYNSLLGAGQTGWDLGVVFSMPLGFPQERAQARNLELRIAKAQAAIAAQESEVSEELMHAYQEMQRWKKTTRAVVARQAAAKRRLDAVNAEYEADRASLTQLIDAHLAMTRARSEYQRSLVGQAQALTEAAFRRGSILQAQQIFVQYPAPRSAPEGPIPSPPEPPRLPPQKPTTPPLLDRASIPISNS